MKMNHSLPTIPELRNAFENGENITALLKEKTNLPLEEIVEIAYDIQSGTYTKMALENPNRLNRYAMEIFELCKDHIYEKDTLLDCGAGELTTLSALSQYLPESVRLLACDISLSRLGYGRKFSQKFMRHKHELGLKMFVADMALLPLGDNSVDVVFTSHALEPNHGREELLLSELFRVARRKLILFEPSWEYADDKIRSRMIEHGYVRSLPSVISAIGGSLISFKPLPNSLNPMNPTYCYIIEKKCSSFSSEDLQFTCPVTTAKLVKKDTYYYSIEGGLAYPEIKRIACLRKKHAILMSHV